ncbi:MAG: 16S rRNA (guanine(527)-N(7))-methyltransferase RsmG [Streptococcaceae bacterium]|jgi:16S rRNA (guanine527-N7)-methyltransferase|nr:16S rRNA (guanine(527)-N(7))-methyltransferase RsmG [Streptococcaceae bacterium]
MTPEEFATLARLTEQQKQQFALYFELLIDWNSRMNLTALTSESDVYLKHFYDSLMPVALGALKNEPLALLDIGAGAGFPSLPMKIVCPELKITIIDSLQKRINFLSALTEALGLAGVTLIHGRAEELGRQADFRGQFDFVTARAVARLNVLSELTVPFLKKNGQLLSLKASQFDVELSEAQHAIATLGARFDHALDYALPDGSARHIAVIEKTKETPKKYPRNAGQIKKNPL